MSKHNPICSKSSFFVQFEINIFSWFKLTSIFISNSVRLSLILQSRHYWKAIRFLPATLFDTEVRPHKRNELLAHHGTKLSDSEFILLCDEKHRKQEISQQSNERRAGDLLPKKIGREDKKSVGRQKRGKKWYIFNKTSTGDLLHVTFSSNHTDRSLQHAL